MRIALDSDILCYSARQNICSEDVPGYGYSRSYGISNWFAGTGPGTRTDDRIRAKTRIRTKEGQGPRTEDQGPRTLHGQLSGCHFGCPLEWQISHFGACNSRRWRRQQEMTAICAGRRVIGEPFRRTRILRRSHLQNGIKMLRGNNKDRQPASQAGNDSYK